MFKLGIHKHTQHKESVAPALETSKTASMEEVIYFPITQIGDEVKVVGESRRQSLIKFILMHYFFAC